MLRRALVNSQGSPRSTLDREQVHAPYATVIVDKLVSRGLAERTAYDSHPRTVKVPNLCRPAPAVMSSPLTALEAAENFASQIRAFSGGRVFRKGDAGLAEDAEVQFPGPALSCPVEAHTSALLSGPIEPLALLPHPSPRKRHQARSCCRPLRLSLHSRAF